VQFDLDELTAADRYELLLGTIVPRPIALLQRLRRPALDCEYCIQRALY